MKHYYRFMAWWTNALAGAAARKLRYGEHRLTRAVAGHIVSRVGRWSNYWEGKL